jgi:hypothetical protein
MKLPEHNDDIKICWFLFIQILVIWNVHKSFHINPKHTQIIS